MKKKAGHGGGGHGGGGAERWLLTYADLITLLMVFFIVLYAMSEVDKSKYASVARYLMQAFNAGGNMVVNTGMGAGDGVSVPMPSDLEERVKKPAPEPAGPKQQPEPLEGIGQHLAVDFMRDGRFTVRLADRGLILSLAGSAAFDSGQAEIKPDFIPLLDAIAADLKTVPHDISVEGFTDSDPIRSAQFPSNWYLSVARANTVRDYLESKGINRERLIVVGYGDTRPAFSNATPEGKARNRRVDIVVLRNPQVIDLGKELTKP